MKSILRAFAVLGASSVATVLAGIVTMKIVAVELGPSGLGLWALLRSLLGVAAIVAGFGIGTALVRLGAEAIAGDDRQRLKCLWRAAWLVYWSLSVPLAVAIFVFRGPIAALFLGDASETAAVSWIALALAFTVAGYLNTGFINANHRVSALARLAVLVGVAQGVSAVTIVVIFGHAGVPFVVLSATVIAWATSRWIMIRETPRDGRCPSSAGSKLMRPLLAFGGPFALGSLVGGGVMMLLPVLVVTLFDDASVGYVRAASAISVTYVGFLLKAMSQDYFPRLSAVSGDHEQVNEMVNRQLDAIYLVAVPFVFLAMALAPVAIPILYSPSFTPAVDILQWQLVGDVFKFTSWALAFTILARGKTWTYLGTESIAGVLLLSTTYVGLNLMGLEGYGVAYAVSYVAYFAVVLLFVRRGVGFRFTSGNLVKLVFLGGGAIAVRLVLSTSASPWAYLLPALVGVVTAAHSIRRGSQVWQEADTA